jgi:hypothetical protein
VIQLHLDRLSLIYLSTDGSLSPCGQLDHGDGDHESQTYPLPDNERSRSKLLA